MDRIHRMSRGRKTLLSLLLVGALGAVAGIGTFSAFSATTVNAGNTFDAGTVVDLPTTTPNAAMYNITDATPDDVRRAVHPGDLHGIARRRRCACTRLAGRRDRAVRRPLDRQGHHAGATAFPNCTGFMPERRTSTRGTLGGFAAAHTNFANGAAATPGVQTAVEPEQHARLPVHADAAEQRRARPALTSGLHSFTWEAQNV